MDAIFLNEMRVETIVGIWDWERKTKQIVSIDIEMGADIKKAALTDNIEDTLNYKGVSKRIRKFVEDSDFQLVETMAEKIAEIILVEFNVPWVKIRVNKPGAIRGSKDVGVFITRTQES